MILLPYPVSSAPPPFLPPRLIISKGTGANLFICSITVHACWYDMPNSFAAALIDPSFATALSNETRPGPIKHSSPLFTHIYPSIEKVWFGILLLSGDLHI